MSQIAVQIWILFFNYITNNRNLKKTFKTFGLLKFLIYLRAVYGAQAGIVCLCGCLPEQNLENYM